MQEEENEKLGSRENNQVVRKLIKLTHTGLSTKVSMEVEKTSKFWKQKTREGKEIFGWKKKSKVRNRKNEALMKTETLKFTEKWNKSETTTPVGVKENQGNY